MKEVELLANWYKQAKAEEWQRKNKYVWTDLCVWGDGNAALQEV